MVVGVEDVKVDDLPFRRLFPQPRQRFADRPLRPKPGEIAAQVVADRFVQVFTDREGMADHKRGSATVAHGTPLTGIAASVSDQRTAHVQTLARAYVR